MIIPTIDAIKKLDGRIFAMLSKDEETVLNFYRGEGRKFDVAVSIINEADAEALTRAASRRHSDQIMKSANSCVWVVVGADCLSSCHAGCWRRGQPASCSEDHRFPREGEA